MDELSDKNATWLVKDFALDVAQCRSLGEGAYGKVFAVKWKGCLVAAKKLFSRYFNQSSTERVSARTRRLFEQECSLLARLHHPHIVQLFGVHLPDDYPNASPIMIMELLDQTLRKRISSHPRLDLLEVINHSLEIASALCFLHERDEPIIHRDLSSNNIMLTSSGQCKLVDLGVAKVFNEAIHTSQTLQPGHEYYMPGEVLAGGIYDERLDTFSLGVVVMEMVVGHPPQPSHGLLEGGDGEMRLVAETTRRANDLLELGVNNPLRPLIERLLQPQASRPKIGEVYTTLEAIRESPAVTAAIVC